MHTNKPTNTEYLYSGILRNFTITENESDSVNQLNESFFLNSFSSSFRLIIFGTIFSFLQKQCY